LNYLQAFRLYGTWGRSVLVVLAVMTPVDFVENLGPVFVPCSAKHLNIAKNVLRDSCKNRSPHGRLPDTYWVAIAPRGWAKEVKPVASPKDMIILVEPSGATWRVYRPALLDMATCVRVFARSLEPATVHQRMEAIREWVVEYLEAFEFVTASKVQDVVEEVSHTAVAADEVLAVFDELEAEGKFRKDPVSGKAALRLATPAERTGRCQ